MKAIILAGGFGTRLHPITDSMPKPMAPILGEPALAHIITYLCKNGIYDAALTLKYMPEQIVNTFRDCFCGVNLSYYTEDEPLGTAGGVKNAEDFFDGEDMFAVISGDCICDLDLRGAIEYHIAKNADVTVMLKTVSDPLAYGTVLCDGDGRIKGFCEKPSWDEVRSNAVNTGIYIINRRVLDLIPKDTVYDFSKDLFPYLLANGYRMYGSRSEGDWCDIGSIEEYLRCNIEALEGKYSLFSSVSPREYCYKSVISPTAEIGEGSECIGCVVHDGVRIGKGCRLLGTVVCRDASIGDGTVTEYGCVIGQGAVIADGTHIYEDMRIRCGEVINGEEKSVRIKSGKLFCDGGIRGDFFSYFGIDTLSALGSAMGAVCPDIGVMYDGDERCVLAAQAFMCGVRYAGVTSYDLGVCPLGACACACSAFGMGLTVHISSCENDGYIRLGAYDKDGLCPSKCFEDEVVKKLYSHKKSGHDIGKSENLGGILQIYEKRVCDMAKNGLDGVSVCLAPHKYSSVYSKILHSLGVRDVRWDEKDGDALYCEISEDTRHLRVRASNKFTERGEDIYRILTVILANIDGVSRIALPHGMPSDMYRAAEKNGIKVSGFLSQPSVIGRAESEARTLWGKHPWLYDPFCTLVKLCDIMKRKGKTLSELSEEIGEFCIREEYITAEDEKKARILRAVYEHNLKDNDSYHDAAVVKAADGEVSFICGTNGLHVLIRAYNTEAASEIAESVKREIDKL